MSIKKTILMGLARHVLTIAGGALVSKGFLSEDLAMQLVGGLIGLLGMAWSADDKQQRSRKIPKALPLPDTSRVPPILPDNLPVQTPFASTKKSGGFILSERSRENLVGVHPLLVKVVEMAIAQTPVDFVVTEGLRTEARQRQLIIWLLCRITKSVGNGAITNS